MSGNDLITLLWGLGPFGLYGIVLLRKLQSWRIHHDRRSSREVVTALALAFAATCSALSFVSIVLMIGDQPVRRVLAGLAFAAFGAAGVVMLQESGSDGSDDR